MQSLIPDFKVLEGGSAPLIAAMCDEIRLSEILDQLITWDEKQCRLSPGLRIKALVVNVLSHRRPLYKVTQAFQNYDLEVLFGAGVTPDALNDDALGRALDKLGETKPETIYLTLALTAMKIHGVTIKSMHGDTTSVSVYGDYDYEDDADVLNITRGYSKAHRPDLKQFLYGLVTNQEGIPFFGQIEDGNLDDKSWNKKMLTTMQELLPDLGSQKPLYVADSALVTEENLKLLKNEIPFVSRLPNTYKLVEELKEEAFAAKQWQDIGALGQQKNAAHYKFQKKIASLYDREYRFIIVYSSALDKKKAQTIEKNLLKTQEQYDKDAQALAKKSFYCEADAQSALEEFLRKLKDPCFNLKFSISSEEQIIRKRGRPSLNASLESKIFYRVQYHGISRNEPAVNQLKERASCFVLISNVLNEDNIGDIDLLREYKEQSKVESTFRFLKDPVFVDGIYLKNPQRVVALGYVFLMSLLIFALLQRRVRKNLQKETQPIILPGNIKSFTPTGRMLLELLEPMKTVQLLYSDGLQRTIPQNNLTNNVLRLLKLAGFSEKIYVTVKEQLIL